jgi:hypothetical protein
LFALVAVVDVQVEVALEMVLLVELHHLVVLFLLMVEVELVNLEVLEALVVLVQPLVATLVVAMVVLAALK